MSNRRSAARLLRIAVLVDSARAFGRGILHGIAECMREHRHWLMYYQEGAQGELLPKWFDQWQGDGIIARIEDPRMAQALVRKQQLVDWLRRLPKPIGVMACPQRAAGAPCADPV